MHTLWLKLQVVKLCMTDVYGKTLVMQVDDDAEQPRTALATRAKDSREYQ
jgi:hypothetical protein